jgi:Chemotaxis signal transduction protein
MAEINQMNIQQYLTFKLADEVYAINVANIKEVLGVPKITKVPRMPAFMSGIINLRGSVVPVLDLCKKFGLGETTFTVDTGIIVTEIDSRRDDGTDEELIIGIFSDMVQKVITIDPENIEPPPKIGVAIDTSFIRGMGHVENSFIIILDINKILTGSELQAIQAESLEA